MSRDWLEGRLDGVAPRAELSLLRDAVVRALDEGEDVDRLIVALTRLDPVAGAELVAGARALPHAAVVRAALPVAVLLEDVLPPAGLYRRLADLAPATLPDLLTEAASRHLGAPWWWRLGAGAPDHALSLAAAADPDRAPHHALDHGYRDAVLARAARGDAPSLRALHDRASREVLLRALVQAFDAGIEAPVVPWFAAWHGPDVDPLFTAVARRLTTDAGRARLATAAVDLPRTRAALGG